MQTELPFVDDELNIATNDLDLLKNIQNQIQKHKPRGGGYYRCNRPRGDAVWHIKNIRGALAHRTVLERKLEQSISDRAISWPEFRTIHVAWQTAMGDQLKAVVLQNGFRSFDVGAPRIWLASASFRHVLNRLEVSPVRSDAYAESLRDAFDDLQAYFRAFRSERPRANPALALIDVLVGLRGHARAHRLRAGELVHHMRLSVFEPPDEKEDASRDVKTP